MTEDAKVRDAHGRVIAIINRQALQTWLRFGTTTPSFSTLAARLRQTRPAVPASGANGVYSHRSEKS
jgi:putative SOS response-associated peptidase YedK